MRSTLLRDISGKENLRKNTVKLFTKEFCGDHKIEQIENLKNTQSINKQRNKQRENHAE